MLEPDTIDKSIRNTQDADKQLPSEMRNDEMQYNLTFNMQQSQNQSQVQN